jgi:hypothetical protein
MGRADEFNHRRKETMRCVAKSSSSLRSYSDKGLSYLTAKVHPLLADPHSATFLRHIQEVQHPLVQAGRRA